MKPLPNPKLNHLFGINLLDCKVLHELTKKKSHFIIQYMQDYNDLGIFYILTIKKSTEEIVNCVVITDRDLQRRVDYDKECGWVENLN